MPKPLRPPLAVGEWRTVALAVVIYGGWLTLVLSHRHVPWWITMSLLAVVLAWHGSLQHEVVHGHPFASRAANDALGSVPLSPRLPYQAYRRYHLRHHASHDLTHPMHDVESYYLTPEGWSRLSRVSRWGAVAHSTLLGRMILGPPLELARTWRTQLRGVRDGDRELGRYWVEHIGAVALLGAFVVGIAGMPFLTYAGAIYFGHGLGLVRSFAEHRWVDDERSRSAVVRAGRFFSLLFLNNNLHHAHHTHPGVAWYRLPALADELGSDEIAAEGAGLYSGYLDVAGRYAVRPFDGLVHPRCRDEAESSRR